MAATLVLAACSPPGPDTSLRIAEQGLLSAAISPDADFAVVGSIHHGGSGWNLSNKERLYNWNHKPGEMSTLRGAGLSGDGEVAVTVEDRNLAVWKTSTGASLGFWQASDKVLALAVDRKGEWAILGQQNNQAVLFNLRTGSERFALPHDDKVFAVAITDDGTMVMTGADDFNAVIWNASTGEAMHRYRHENQVKQVALSADGTLAFSSAQREQAFVYGLPGGDVKARIPMDYENYTAVRFIDDSKRILLGTFRGDIYDFTVLDMQQRNHWKAKARQQWGPASSSAVLALAESDGEISALMSDGMFQTFLAR